MVVSAGEPKLPTQRWWILFLLMLLLVVSFLDRTVLALLVKPIKADLGITDQQFALVYGLSFALFFGCVGLPIARLVDRSKRKPIVLAGVLIWAAATALAGFAGSFSQLLFLRMFLAIGEATLSPATASLIADLFPLRMRVAASAIHSAGTLLGNYGSLAVGGLMISALGSATWFGLAGWRLVLVIAALPALLLAVVFAVSTREPERTVDRHGDAEVQSLREFMRFLGRNRRLYLGYMLGATGPAIVLFAYSAWMPELVARTFGMAIGTVGVQVGVIGMLCGLAGNFTVPIIASRVIAIWPGAPAAANLVCIALGCISAVLMPLQHSAGAMLVCYGITIFTLTAAVNGTLAGLQLIAPRRALGTLNSMGLFCISVAGLGVGPSAAAGLAALIGGATPLNSALALLAPLVIVPSIILLSSSLKPVKQRIAEVAALALERRIDVDDMQPCKVTQGT